MDERIETIRNRLAEIADELGDLAMDALRASIEAGERRAPVERRLTRARRAVERAAGILAGGEDDSGDGAD